MRTGYRYALRQGYDIAVQIDADGQHDPAYLPALLDGSRPRRHRDRRPLRAARATPTSCADRVAGRWCCSRGCCPGSPGTRLTDVTSGFRASNRRAIAVFAAHYPAEYLGDTVESLVIAVRTGCTVAQVPVEMRLRAAGQPSSSPVRAAVYLLRAVVALGLALVRRWEESFDEGATRTNVADPEPSAHP